MDDPKAHVSLSHRIELEQADAFRLGWEKMVVYELRRMRRELPYADSLVLRLETTREPHV